MLYVLNFENEAAFAGWHVGAPGQYEWLKNVKNGKYLFEYPSGFLESQDFAFADVQIAVEAEFLVKTQVEVGLACRMQPDASGRYYFTISNDGRWNIRKWDNGETLLAEGRSEVIRPDKNRLAARCVGDQLTLFANEVELGSARDGDFVSGGLNFGYMAENAGAGTFDNILVEDWATGQAAAPQPKAETGELLYTENFDNPDKLTGWDAKLDEKSQANPQDGAYHLGVDGSMAAFIQREQSFTDAVIEVDVQFLDPDPARAGVICRNDAGQYQFTLSSAGEWMIESSGKTFASGQAAMQTGFNHLAISCVGSQLGLSLNGVQLGVAQDNAFSQGQIGLTLESKGKAQVLFDNLTVRRPAAQAAEAAPTQVAALEPVTPMPAPVATATPTRIPVPAATLRPTQIPQDQLVLYQTEFDDSDPTLADWKTFAYSFAENGFVTEGYEAYTVNGVFRTRVTDPEAGINLRVFSIYDKELDTSDVDISTLGRSPSYQGSTGLVCRYSEAGWYQFMVEPHGMWSIRLAKPDQNGQFHFHLISSGLRWLNPKADLRAECKGDRLTFTIDGEKVASLHDSTFPTGKVGLVGWNFPITGEIDRGMKAGEIGITENFTARRAQWSESVLPGPAPTPGADETIYSTDFAKLDDLNPYWVKTDWGVSEIPGSPLLIGGPGGQIAPHTYRYINDFDPDQNIEIEADIRGAYNFTRGLICRYSEDGWYEAFYQKGSPDDFVTLVRQQRNEQGRIIKGSYTVLGTYILPMISQVNLTLTCAGNQISVKLNGEQILYAEDNTWSSGRYGFLFMDNPPGNPRGTLLNYTVRPAQSAKVGDVIYDKTFETPEQIAGALQVFADDRVHIIENALELAPTKDGLHLRTTTKYEDGEIHLATEIQAESRLTLHCRSGSPADIGATVRGNGDWDIWGMEQALANGNSPVIQPGKNLFVLSCINDQVNLSANGETLATVTLVGYQPASGINGLDVFDFSAPILVSQMRLKALQSGTLLASQTPLNQVSLPPSYQPGETIFAWDMNDFLSGCGGGWWGRDPNPCFWKKAYNEFEIWKHHTDSDILVTLDEKNLTLFTYHPDLYDQSIEISADVTLTSKGGGAALFCRATANGRYEFLIQPNGRWFIYRTRGDDYERKAKNLTTLAHGSVENFTPENAQLSATCSGSDLVFSLNGAELGRVQDTLYPEGQVGIFFDAFSEGSFTNLVIKRAK